MATVRELIQHGMDALEDAYLGAIEAERVRRGESSTRSLDAVIADLGLDDSHNETTGRP
jgi:predicted DNA-binding protein